MKNQQRICLFSLGALAVTSVAGCAGVDPAPLKKQFESEATANPWPEGTLGYSVGEYKGRESLSIQVRPDNPTAQELVDMVSLATNQAVQAGAGGLTNTSVSVRSHVDGMEVISNYAPELGTLEEVAELPGGFATKAELNLRGKGVFLDLAGCADADCATRQESTMATVMSSVRQAQIAGFLPGESGEEFVFIHFNIPSVEGEKAYELRLDSTYEHQASAADLSDLMQLRSELDDSASPATAYSLTDGAQSSRAIISSLGLEHRLDEQEVERIRESVLRASCGRIDAVQFNHSGYDRTTIQVDQAPECA